jgi:bifunctional enzyme CysN/CysC
MAGSDQTVDRGAAAGAVSDDEKRLIQDEIEAYLRKYQDKELLRFVAVGSVDDGKSTLIGRLLYDTNSVYEDQLAAARKASHMAGTEIDLSLITDGLAAEREQGITIDVAYRYFTTDRRKFIIADTPGHVQYTRNMVTGASTAAVAILLIDARLGVLQQSRRHAYIASLLGIPHLAVCVNKMDLVNYDRGVFEAVRKDFSAFTKGLGFSSVTFFPISALKGTNCVTRGAETSWYEGPTVLEFLESVPVRTEREDTPLRYPVQYVLRPNLDYRGFAGRIASGSVKKGDPIVVLPSGKTSRVKAIDVFEGERESASAPESVTLRLEDEIDVSRGDILVHPRRTSCGSRRRRWTRARATSSSTRRRPPASTSRRSTPRRTSTPWPTCPPRRSRSTRSAGRPSRRTARSSSTGTPTIGRPAPSFSSTRSRTPPSRRG